VQVLRFAQDDNLVQVLRFAQDDNLVQVLRFAQDDNLVETFAALRMTGFVVPSEARDLLYVSVEPPLEAPVRDHLRKEPCSQP
jgi:hypothetical protein